MGKTARGTTAQRQAQRRSGWTRHRVADARRLDRNVACRTFDQSRAFADLSDIRPVGRYELGYAGAVASAAGKEIKHDVTITLMIEIIRRLDKRFASLW